MAKLAFLGLGAMGSRMAARLLEAGHELTVWNRSPDRAAPLADKGARVAATPREAVEGAEIAVAMLRDDEASQAVWLDGSSGALARLAPGALVVESSTVSLAFARDLAARMEQAGRAFIDAPVSGSRPQAEAGQLIYLVGGEADAVARAEPVLRAMGGAVHHVGPAGAGTAAKLAVNALFGIQIAALGELLPALRASGLDLARVVEALGATPVCSPAARVAAGSMLAGAFQPNFPVELVAKDFRYALGLAPTLPVTQAAHGVFQRALDEGLGAEQLTAVVKLYP